MHFSRRRISPSKARELLDTQTRNRPLRSAWVNELARRMSEGLWNSATGDTLKLDLNGKLLDGQHRLEAVCLCGKTFTFSIAAGIAPESQEFMDQNKLRTAADDLAMHGVRQPHFIAAAVRLGLLYEEGSLLRFSASKRDARGVKYAAAHSPREIRAYYNRNPALSDYAGSSAGPVRQLMSPSLWIFLRKIFADVDETAAETFMSRLKDGVALDSMSPIYALRRRLMADRQGIRRQDRLARVTRIALCIKAWNFWRKGRKTSRIQYAKGEKIPVAA